MESQGQDNIGSFRMLIRSHINNRGEDIIVEELLDFVNSYLKMFVKNHPTTVDRRQLKMALIAAIVEIKGLKALHNHDGLLRLYQRVMELSETLGSLGLCEHIDAEDVLPGNINFYIMWATLYAKDKDTVKFQMVLKKARKSVNRTDVDEKFRLVADEYHLNVPSLDSVNETTMMLLGKKAESRRRSSVAALESRPMQVRREPMAPRSKMMVRESFQGDVSPEEYRAAQFEDSCHDEVGRDDDMDMDISVVDDYLSDPPIPQPISVRPLPRDSLEPLMASRQLSSAPHNPHRTATPPTLECIREIATGGEKDMSRHDDVIPRRSATSERSPVECFSPASAPCKEKKTRMDYFPVQKDGLSQQSFTTNFYEEAKNVFSDTVNLEKQPEIAQHVLDESEVVFIPKKVDDFEIFCDSDASIQMPPQSGRIELKENNGVIPPSNRGLERRPLAPLGQTVVEADTMNKESVKQTETVRDSLMRIQQPQPQSMERTFRFDPDEETVAGFWKNGAERDVGLLTSTPAVKNQMATHSDFFTTSATEEDEETVPADDLFAIPVNSAFAQRRLSLHQPPKLGRLPLAKPSFGTVPVNESVSTAIGKMSLGEEKNKQEEEEKIQSPPPTAPIVSVNTMARPTFTPYCDEEVESVEKKEEDMAETDDVDLDATGIGLPEEAVTSDINPWDNQLREKIMKGYQDLNLHEFDSNCARIRAAGTFQMGGETYRVHTLIGQGGFAKVFKATTEKETLVALKLEIPPCAWEGFICNTLLDRLGNKEKAYGVMKVEETFVFKNASVIVNEFIPFGNLLDITNKLRDCNWQLVTLLSIQIARILRDVHACGIIHADVKPDNLMILGKVPESCTVEELLSLPTVVRLIDWGRAIDHKSINTSFTGRAGTACFDCPEMMEGRPWTYQTDFFGYLGTVHVMHFGKYMAVKKSSDGRNMMSSAFKRRNLAREVVGPIFDELLNVPDCNNLPNWDSIIGRQTELLRSHFDISSWRDVARAFNQNLGDN